MTHGERVVSKFIYIGLIPATVFALDVSLYVSMKGWTYNLHDNGRDTFWPIVLIFGAFFFPIAAGTLAKAVFDLWAARASTRWSGAEGRVTDSAIENVERSRRGWIGYETYYEYRPAVSYAYEVAGQTYDNNVIGFGLAPLEERGEAEQLLHSYPKGCSVRVHYDPDDPQASVLLNAGGWALRAAMSALIAAAFPFGIAIVMVLHGS
jgi:hypothetical protein